jgi:hypothetical protein
MWEDKVKQWMSSNLDICIDMANSKIDVLRSSGKFWERNGVIESEIKFYEHVVDQLETIDFKLNI